MFEKLGLEPSDEMLNDFSEGSLGYGHYDDRYGNGYADLSRLVTYYLRNGKEVVTLFSKDSKPVESGALQRESQAVSGPAKLIIDAIAFMAGKGPVGQDFSKASFSGSSIKEGACKDSEVYFSSALNLGKAFLEDNFVRKSGYGADTSLSTVPIQAAGFEFPKGYLFRVGKKGEIEPLRATMYCFNNEEAKDAFGWQYEECLQNEPQLRYAIEDFPDDWRLPVKTAV